MPKSRANFILHVNVINAELVIRLNRLLLRLAFDKHAKGVVKIFA